MSRTSRSKELHFRNVHKKRLKSFKVNDEVPKNSLFFGFKSPLPFFPPSAPFKNVPHRKLLNVTQFISCLQPAESINFLHFSLTLLTSKTKIPFPFEKNFGRRGILIMFVER